jgi:diguanylate cyclase (GGDEF)-like protein
VAPPTHSSPLARFSQLYPHLLQRLRGQRKAAETKPLSLRQTAMLAVGLGLTGLVGGLYLVSSKVLSAGYQNLERRDMEQHMERVLQTYQKNLDDLKFFTLSWGGWDEAYEFVQRPTPDFIERNYSDDVLLQDKASLVVMLNHKGQIVHGLSYDKARDRQSLPPSVAAYLKANPNLLKHRKTEQCHQGLGILPAPESPIYFAACPVSTSQFKGPIRGTVFMAHYLDEAAIAKFQEMTRSQIQIYRLNELEPELQTIVKSLTSTSATTSSTISRPTDNKTISGFRLLRDWSGQPALLLKTELPREIHAQGNLSSRYLLLSIGILGLLSGISSMVLIGKLMQAWQRQQTSQNRYQAVVTQASEGIFLLDAETGNFLETNLAFQSLLGYNAAELAEINLSDILVDFHQKGCSIGGYAIGRDVKDRDVNDRDVNDRDVNDRDVNDRELDGVGDRFSSNTLDPVSPNTEEDQPLASSASLLQHKSHVQSSSNLFVVNSVDQASTGLSNPPAADVSTNDLLTEISPTDVLSVPPSAIDVLPINSTLAAASSPTSDVSDVSVSDVSVSDVSVSDVSVSDVSVSDVLPVNISNSSSIEPLLNDPSLLLTPLQPERTEINTLSEVDELFIDAQVENQLDAQLIDAQPSDPQSLDIQSQASPQGQLTDSQSFASSKIRNISSATGINRLAAAIQTENWDESSQAEMLGVDSETNSDTDVDQRSPSLNAQSIKNLDATDPTLNRFDANVFDANVFDANVSDANVSDANVSGANVSDVSTNEKSSDRQFRHRDGRLVDMHLSVNVLNDKDRNILCVVAHDVTDRNRTEAALRESEQRLSWQASHDDLTGLVNRREFERRLQSAIADCQSFFHQHTLCYIDLDQFKIVNDTCGHVVGDELLRQVTDLLRTRVRATDVLARLGGDEFGLLLNHCPIEQAFHITNVMRQSLQDFRFIWQGKVFNISISIGIVEINSASQDLPTVLSAADAACYVAKNKGRNRIHIYQPDDCELLNHKSEMEWVRQLTQALEENRFVLYAQAIQPIFSELAQGEHYEILLRLRDENEQLIAPGIFMPAAERYNLMNHIDRWVIRALFANQAEHYRQTWARCQETNYHCLYAINLSGASINDEQFIEFLQQELEEHQVPPQVLCFEITETVAIANLSRATQFIQTFRALGCHFALDDFGSGMSSFGYLKNLPVDYLKIDGSFVKDILKDETRLAIVEAINQVGHVMGLKTVAEFVENNEILEKLRAIGVDYAQGYGIAKPTPMATTAIAQQSPQPLRSNVIRLSPRT